MPTYDSIIDYADLGPTLPEAVASDVIKTLPQQSAALTLCRSVRMSTKALTQPVLGSLPLAYWVNGPVGLKQTTDLVWRGVTLTAEEIATILPIPENIIDDSGFPIWSEARPLLAEAIGLLLDATVFGGTAGTKPASWPDGLIPQAIAAGNVNEMDSTPDQGGAANDILETFDDVEEDGYDVSGIAADRTLRSKLRNARDTSGQKLLDISTNQLEGVPISYVGFGVFPPTAKALVGDFSMAMIGIRQDINYKMLDQAVISDDLGKVILNLAQQDAVAMRVTARFGFAVANPVTRSPNVNPFPFSVLQDTVTALQEGAEDTWPYAAVTEGGEEYAGSPHIEGGVEAKAYGEPAEEKPDRRKARGRSTRTQARASRKAESE